MPDPDTEKFNAVMAARFPGMDSTRAWERLNELWKARGAQWPALGRPLLLQDARFIFESLTRNISTAFAALVEVLGLSDSVWIVSPKVPKVDQGEAGNSDAATAESQESKSHKSQSALDRYVGLLPACPECGSPMWVHNVCRAKGKANLHGYRSRWECTGTACPGETYNAESHQEVIQGLEKRLRDRKGAA